MFSTYYTNYVSVTGYNGNADNVVIPKTYRGIPVKEIKDSAFSYQTRLKSITLPDSVTSIGNDAFYGCSGLTSIFVDKRNTKYHSAGNCLIETATKTLILGCKTSVIPTDGSVTSIGNYAFYDCTGLTSITIPDSVTHIGDYAFSYCTGLTSVIIGNNVTSIGGGAFRDCTGLTSITIPDSVTSIGFSAFRGCSSLESITIPFVGAKAGVTSNGTYQYPFGYIFGTSSYTGGIATKQYYYGSSTSSTTSETYYIPSSLKFVTVTGGNILYGAFYNCTGLTSVTIGKGVTSIGNAAFYGCNKIQDIYITDIGAWCNISGLDNLMEYGASNKNLYINNNLATSITIPNGVAAIPTYAFYNCSGLTNVTIPDSVTSIGNAAFYGCNKITSISGSIDVISKVAKQASPKSFVGNITSGTSVIASAFSGMTGLKGVTIPDSVTSIGERAFFDCTGLTSVTIPDSVTSIGERAFRDCAGLTSVTIGNRVTSIGDAAFYNCTELTSVTIPDSVTSIGGSAFAWCSSLTSITIPDRVTSIGGDAFYNTAWYNNQPDGLVYAGKVAYKYKGTMPSNTSIVLKEGTLGIADSAFAYCTGLTSITIPDSVTSIGDGVFSDCTGLTSITVAKGNTKYHSAENCLIETESKTLIAGCKNSIIPTDGSVTSIGSYAFKGCTGLTSIVIPDSVTSIGSYAFYYCTGLTNIKFNGTIKQWNAISKGDYWKKYMPSECKVFCTDGTTSI